MEKGIIEELSEVEGTVLEWLHFTHKLAILSLVNFVLVIFCLAKILL